MTPRLHTLLCLLVGALNGFALGCLVTSQKVNHLLFGGAIAVGCLLIGLLLGAAVVEFVNWLKQK